jgi:hypothetical protein
VTITLALLAAGVLGAWIVRCLHRAARQLDRIQRETADAAVSNDGLTRLADVIRAEPEPTPADRTPVGDDDWTRHMRRHIRHTAKRRNTGRRPQ